MEVLVAIVSPLLALGGLLVGLVWLLAAGGGRSMSKTTQEEAQPFLPYRCEKMRSESLHRPCEKNLARIKALQAKNPEAHIGPLEHCLECRGRDLVVLPAPGPMGPPVDLPAAAPRLTITVLR